MRPVFWMLVSLVWLWAADVRPQAIANDGTVYAETLPVAPDRLWMAVNLTPDLITLTTRNEAGIFEVRALASSGTGLVQVHLLPDENGSEADWLYAFEIKPSGDAFAIALPDKRPDVPAAISDLPKGARVVQEGQLLRYEGPKKGSFQVGYLDGSGRYVREQIAVTPSGLIAFAAFLEVEQGGSRTAPWRASFTPEPAMVMAPQLGDAVLDAQGVTYGAHSLKRGIDRVIFVPHIGADAVILPVRVLSRTSALRLPHGQAPQRQGERQVYRFENDGGFEWEIALEPKGVVQATLKAGEETRFFLEAPPRSRLEVNAEGGLNFNYGDIALQISAEGFARGIVHQTMLSVEGAGHYTVLPGGALQAALFWPHAPQAGLFADRFGARVWQNVDGAESHLGLITPGSRLSLDGGGVNAQVRLGGAEWFLPFGWVYGRDTGGELKRIRPVWNEESATMIAPWDDWIRVSYAGFDFLVEPLSAVRHRLSLQAGWNRTVGQGFLRLPAAGWPQVGKVIAAAEEETQPLWPQRDAALPAGLNTLHALHGGHVYHIRAQTAVELDVLSVPHAPLWRVADMPVGIPEGSDVPMELSGGCRLIDETGANPSYYAAGGEYRLRCIKDAP